MARKVYDGVRVVEMATGISAPYATMFLADHGAEVVKIEPPGGDPYRTEPGFQTFNRGKHSVVADDPADLDHPLLATADVLVTDRPGHGARLKARYPGAIVVAMPPWGERGPKVDDPASPDLLAAATGIMWKQQSYAEVPVRIVLPLVAYGTGVLGGLALAAALFARERDGVAPHYEVSEVAGSAAIQLGEFYIGDEPEERPGYSPMGSKGLIPVYRLFEAGDGRWFFLACGTTRFFERMVTAVGRPDLIGHPDLPFPPWGLGDHDAIEFIVPILEAVFATEPRQHWLDTFRQADVPAQPVQTREEFLAGSIAGANELSVTVEHPELGPVSMMGLPVVVEAAPGRVERPAPRLGEHDLGPHQPGTGSGQGGPPLEGTTMIDLASFIAGPVVTRHLAMLGADVVKVEAPSGDPFRNIGPLFCSWNQGKRSVAIDLRTPEGQAMGRSLAASADVVVENFRPGVAARLGVDRESLRAANPELVLLSSPGYGLDETMADAPAFDPLMQALGGVMACQGGTDEPVFLTVPVHDVMTPMLGAFGIVAALYDRLRTGETQNVRTSLAHASAAVQAAELTRYDGAAAPPLGGFDHAGADAEHCVGPTDLGWEYRDGDAAVPVSTVGLSGEAIAVDNDLVVAEEHVDWGRLHVFGQLVGGAGPAPRRSPQFDEHGDEIRARLGGDGSR